MRRASRNFLYVVRLDAAVGVTFVFESLFESNVLCLSVHPRETFTFLRSLRVVRSTASWMPISRIA